MNEAVPAFMSLADGHDLDVLCAADVAAMLRVSERTVGETWLRSQPDFPRPFMLTGKGKRWYRKDIREWVASKAKAYE